MDSVSSTSSSWSSHPQQGKAVLCLPPSLLYSEHTEDISSEQQVPVTIVSEDHCGDSEIRNVLKGAAQSSAINGIKKRVSKGQETLRNELLFS